MKKADFDERQVYMQGKYGRNAFSLSIIIGFTNACIRQYFNVSYASPLNECFMVMLIPLAYFSVATILTSSYFSFSSNKKFNMAVLANLIIDFVFFIAYLFYKNGFADISQSGLYSAWFGILLVCVFNAVLLLAHIIRFQKDKKEENF